MILSERRVAQCKPYIDGIGRIKIYERMNNYITDLACIETEHVHEYFKSQQLIKSPIWLQMCFFLFFLQNGPFSPLLKRAQKWVPHLKISVSR